ncbi:DoxX family protein [Priestia megaterium]|uniref:DoxX family protein n=1 Tax=Priestia megaterium TaxID=1404 RepID=UPI002E240AAD|nr:DoxX family protein [Priestia megaterium]MED4278655.1 DoxX family protein [Priestia megaterium]MED4319080.1 DoxX family protein [Priestia megaterium]
MKWVIRIIQGLLVVGFTAFGVMKLTGNAMQVQTFTDLGYSLGLMYFVGVCEVLGAIGLLVGFWKSKMGLLASGGLILLMAGAAFTHLKAGQGIGAAMPALIFLILSLVVFIGKRAGK